MQAIRSRDLDLDSEWTIRDARSPPKGTQRSAEHGNGGGTSVRFGGWWFIRIGEAERAWQLYRLTSITRANQRLKRSQGQTVREQT
jgi:hypothetical protein